MPKILVISTELDFGGVESGVLLRARVQRKYGFVMEFVCLHKLGRIGNIMRDEGFATHSLDEPLHVWTDHMDFATASAKKEERLEKTLLAVVKGETA